MRIFSKTKLKPLSSDENVIVEYTSPYKLNGRVLVTVPPGYEGDVLVNDIYRESLLPCQDEKLLKKIGKPYKGLTIKMAFVKRKINKMIEWGSRGIDVTDGKVKVSYRVGINGSFELRITEPVKIIRKFGASKNILVDDVTTYVKELVKEKVNGTLNELFIKKKETLKEVELKKEEVYKNLYWKLNSDPSFKELGLEFTSFSIKALYVPEEEREKLEKAIKKYGIEKYYSKEETKLKKEPQILLKDGEVPVKNKTKKDKVKKSEKPHLNISDIVTDEEVEKEKQKTRLKTKN